ncbi:MAG: Pyruvate carboxyl transferase [Myxococcaceae bacterium]|nr:Pyruvate carboxyl transferase [Myxococcaceae bacterium]
MRYFVQAGGREHEVEIATRPDGSVAASVGGRAVALDVVAFSERELSVRVGARVLDLTIEGNAPELGVIASGTRTYVQVESERSRVAGRAKGGGGAVKSRDLRAPMPGRVIKVFVNEGDEVAAGQPLVIVEAMKMENEVKAKGPGVVAKVHAQVGATVEANALLVSFT